MRAALPDDSQGQFEYEFLMNALLDKAIAAVSRLPEAEQEIIAREVLVRIEGDARWAALLADPRSKRALSRMAAETREEIAQGNVLDRDPGTHCE